MRRWTKTSANGDEWLCCMNEKNGCTICTKNITKIHKNTGIMITNLNGLQFLSNSGLNQTNMAKIYTEK